MRPGAIDAVAKLMPANPGRDKLGKAILMVEATHLTARALGIPESFIEGVVRRRR